jgi:hypothetical protein
VSVGSSVIRRLPVTPVSVTTPVLACSAAQVKASCEASTHETWPVERVERCSMLAQTFFGDLGCIRAPGTLELQLLRPIRHRCCPPRALASSQPRPSNSRGFCLNYLSPVGTISANIRPKTFADVKQDMFKFSIAPKSIMQPWPMYSS